MSPCWFLCCCSWRRPVQTCSLRLVNGPHEEGGGGVNGFWCSTNKLRTYLTGTQQILHCRDCRKLSASTATSSSCCRKYNVIVIYVFFFNLSSLWHFNLLPPTWAPTPWSGLHQLHLSFVLMCSLGILARAPPVIMVWYVFLIRVLMTGVCAEMWN